MIVLYRARIAFLIAVVFAVAIFALELPFSELVHQRREVASSENALIASRAKNNALRLDIAALSRASVISAIAHEEYGLVKKGQRSVVILPVSGEPSSPSGLIDASIPPKDLATPEVGGAVVPASSPSTPRSKTGFWSSVLSRLEFWHSV